MVNISKHERARRPTKPEFAWTGVIVGILVGWVGSLVVEIGMGRPKALVMIVGGVAGVLLGFGFEGIRYWWRYRHYVLAKRMNTIRPTNSVNLPLFWF